MKVINHIYDYLLITQKRNLYGSSRNQNPHNGFLHTSPSFMRIGYAKIARLSGASRKVHLPVQVTRDTECSMLLELPSAGMHMQQGSINSSKQSRAAAANASLLIMLAVTGWQACACA